MYCLFIGKAVQTVNPPNNSVNEAQLNYPLTTFSSTGIDDNATSTAVTIDSNENVGIGNTVASTINSANGTGILIEEQTFKLSKYLLQIFLLIYINLSNFFNCSNAMHAKISGMLYL